MSVNEAYFWAQIKRSTPQVDWTRIENSVGNGNPDLNGLYRGREVWVELKIARSRKVKIQATQRMWITRRWTLGARNIFILARDEHRAYLWLGSQVEELFLTGWATPIAVWEKPFPWPHILEALFDHCYVESVKT